MGVACKISIDRPSDGIHRPGETVSGVVKYAIDRPTAYERITISLIGEAYCSWYETDDDSRTRYAGNDTVLRKENSLLPRYRETLPVGAYHYRFLYTVPQNLPSTFEQGRGYVNYAISLEFKKQGVFTLTKVFKEDIIVRSYLDIARPLPDTPIVYQMGKTLFKPLTTGNEKINLKAVAKPFIKPGNIVDIKLIITNDTSVNIKAIKAELIRKTVYIADCGKTNVVEQRLEQCRAETVGIPASSVANLTLRLPTVKSEYTVQNSKVIKNEYEVLMTIRLPMPHCNATARMPILLGEREQDQPSIDHGVDIVRVMEDDGSPPPYWEAVSQ